MGSCLVIFCTQFICGLVYKYIETMEKFEISLTSGQTVHHFEVRDYMHHDGDLCKYEIYQNGHFIASFEPGLHRELHICTDAGILSRDVLYKVADQLERYNI